jgi:hypothetical protein
MEDEGREGRRQSSQPLLSAVPCPLRAEANVRKASNLSAPGEDPPQPERVSNHARRPMHGILAPRLRE